MTAVLLLLLAAVPARAQVGVPSVPFAQLPRIKFVPLIDQLACDPQVIAGFKKAWSDSFAGRSGTEAGFRIDRFGDALSVVHAPMTHEHWRMKIPRTTVTIAIAHTHPDASDPRPSEQDLKSPVANYVISRWALWVTDPLSRRSRKVRGRWDLPCAP